MAAGTSNGRLSSRRGPGSGTQHSRLLTSLQGALRVWWGRRRWQVVVAVVSAAVAACLHLSTLSYGFIWDDRAAVLTNADVARDDVPWSSLLVHDFWGQRMADAGSHKSYRPLTTATYRLNRMARDWWVATYGGPAGGAASAVNIGAWGHHLTNVVLHAVNAAVASALFHALFADGGSAGGGQSKPVASVAVSGGSEVQRVHTAAAAASGAALLWSVHAVHVEPVACLVGRADLLGGLLMMLALLLAQQRGSSSGGGQWWVVAHICALVLGVAATLAKEIGVTVFGVMVLWEVVHVLGRYYYHRRHGVGGVPLQTRVWHTVTALRAQEGWAPVWRVATAVATAVAVVAAHVWLHQGAPVRPWGMLENDIAIMHSRLGRTLSYAYTHWMYMWKLLWPFSLSYDWGYHCIPQVTSLSNWHNLGALVTYGGVAAAGVWGLHTGNRPLLRALALLVVPFLPAAQVAFPVGTVLAERLLYVPSLGACALAAGAAAGALGDPRPPAKHKRPHSPGGSEGGASRARRRSSTRGTTRTVVAAGAEDHEQEEEQGGGGSGGTGTGSHLPTPARLRMAAAAALVVWAAASAIRSVTRCGDWRSERELFTSTLHVCPDGIKSLSNLAMTMLNAHEAREAGALLDRALELYPGFGAAAYNRALAYGLEGRHLEADHMYSRAAQLDPHNYKVPMYQGYAQLKELRGQALAVAADESASERARAVAAAHADALLAEAGALIDKALSMGASHPVAPLARAEWLVASGDPAASIRWFAAAIDTSDAAAAAGADSGDRINVQGAWNDMALAARDGSGPEEGARLFAAAVKRFPTDVTLLTNYGSTLDRAGRHAEARTVLMRVLELQPNLVGALNNMGWSLQQAGDTAGAREYYRRALQAIGQGSDAATATTRNHIQSNLDALDAVQQ